MMAEHILFLYNTIRKYNGEAIVVTQELNDILGNEIVKKSILGHSDTLCLLNQSKYIDHFDEVSEFLNLNIVEQSKTRTINKLDNEDNRSMFKEVEWISSLENSVLSMG